MLKKKRKICFILQYVLDDINIAVDIMKNKCSIKISQNKNNNSSHYNTYFLAIF